MIATARITTAAAQIDQLYSLGGANVDPPPDVIHASKSPHLTLRAEMLV